MSFISYGKQCIEEDDIQAVIEVLRGDWLTQGPKIAEFEQAIAKRCETRHAVAVSSGTAALHCACLAAGIQPGDEIITSPVTFAASGNCALYCGADVKFADIRPDTYCIDPERLKAAITSRTKAVVTVDFTGQPCELDEIMAIAREHELVVIEDAAHALGATYKGRPIGGLADMTTFSFHPVKHITTAEGGMITTNDDELARRLRLLRTHGITNQDDDMELTDQAADYDNQYFQGEQGATRAGWYYEMQALGMNYRISDIQCALGLSQLKKLDRFLKRRREIAERYDQAFASTKHIITPLRQADRESAWHLYVIRLNPETVQKSRRSIFEELRQRQIGVHVHYIPLHLAPYYRKRFGYDRGDFPQAEKYYDTALTIPLHPGLSDQDCNRVIESVMDVIGGCSSKSHAAAEERV